MADDDTDGGRIFPFPGGGDPSYVPPPIATIADALPPREEAIPDSPESPEEATFEIPPVPRPISPEEALNLSEGISGDSGESSPEESADPAEESGPPRGVLERIGEWIDYRIRLGDARREVEAPLREAEIAGKVARLQARTAQEMALAEQNAKFRQAQVKAQADRAAAKGKADAELAAARGKARADRVKATGGSSPAGMGADKGRGKPHSPPKSDDKVKAKADADRLKAQQQAAAAKANEDKRRAQDKARRDADKAQAREQRKADKAAGHKERGGGQWAKALDDRRARKAADRKADRKSGDKTADHLRKEEADQAAHLRREKERDAEHRRKEDAKDADLKREKKRRGLDKDGPDVEKDDAEKEAPDGDSEKDPGKESAPDAEKGPDGASGASDGKPEGDESGAPPEGAEGASDGPEPAEGAEEAKLAGEQEDAEEFWRDLFDDFARRFRKKNAEDTDAGPDAETPPGPIRAEDAGITVERTDQPGPAGEAGEPAAIAPGPLGLPPAPEPHTERPGTTRASGQDGKEERVNTASAPRRTGGQPRMAARHQASITTYEFVDEMAGIDVQAGQCRDIAEKLNEALAKMARELRVWAADLAQDDNIDTAVTDEVANLADDATDMTAVMEQFAQGCKTAANHAFTAHRWVENVYGEDIQAMKDSGLKQASAASHH